MTLNHCTTVASLTERDCEGQVGMVGQLVLARGAQGDISRSEKREGSGADQHVIDSRLQGTLPAERVLGGKPGATIQHVQVTM